MIEKFHTLIVHSELFKMIDSHTQPISIRV